MTEPDKVVIHVVGTQTDSLGEKNVIETTAEGRHYYRHGQHYVLYDDDSLTDTPTPTVLKIEPQAMTLLRRGEVEFEQRFCQNQQTSSRYRTPYGTLELGVATESLSIEYGTVTGSIELSYDMSVNGSHQSRNTLRIEVNCAPGERHRLN